jgi:hypothetical protein
MMKGYLFVKGLLLGRKKPGKRAGTETEFMNSILAKVNEAIKIAHENDLELVFYGGFVDNPRDMKLTLPVINILNKCISSHILLNEKEKQSLNKEDKTIFGVIRALKLANIVSETGSLRDSMCFSNSLFYVEPKGRMPGAIESNNGSDSVVLVSGGDIDSYKEIKGCSKALSSSSEMFVKRRGNTRWISQEALVRRSGGIDGMPSVFLVSSNEAHSVSITCEDSVFLDDENEVHSLSELMEESAFVEKLKEGQSDIASISETDLVTEVDNMMVDEKYSKPSREILYRIFKDTLHSELSDFME